MLDLTSSALLPLAAIPTQAVSQLDSGSTAWLLTSAALVLLMAPGLAFFYGGMVRAKGCLLYTSDAADE